MEDMEELARSDTTAALNIFHDKIFAVSEKLVPEKKIPVRPSNQRYVEYVRLFGEELGN